MRTRATRLVSILCALALVAGLAPLTVGAAVPLMEGAEVAETPAAEAVGTMPHVHDHTEAGETPALPDEEPAALTADANPDYVHDFSTQGTTVNGIYTTISGTLTTASKYGLPFTYGGKERTQGLKMESKTSVKFTAPESGTMTLVFSTPGNKVKLDGTATAMGSDGTYAWSVTAGSHEITKSDSDTVLVYMEFAGTCTGHTYTQGKTKTIKAATCTEPGQAVKLCDNCGAEGETVTLEALGHDWGAGVVTLEATCASAGMRTFTCSRCQETKTETIAATGEHTYSNGKCSVCGLTQGQTPCTTHTMTEDADQSVAATCETAGKKVESCSVCGMTVVTPIPALGHDWSGAWVQTKAPTCTAKGEETLTCKHDSSHTQTREVAMKPHTDADGDGKCDVCNIEIANVLNGAGTWFETLYVETSQFTPDQVTAVSWTGAMNGNMGPGNLFGYDMDYLVRSDGSNGTRIDVPGLTGGTYTLSVTAGGTTYSAANLTVQEHDRSGYAHWNWTEGVGAYRDDGVLKDNAIVIYVTEENKNTVELEAPDGTVVTGIGNILNTVGQESSDNPGYCKRTSGTKTYWATPNSNQGILKKLADADIPLVVRIVGTVSSKHPAPAGGIDGLTAYDSWDYGGSEGDNGNMARMRDCKNITIEGIGPDACIDGWGLHFMASSSTPQYGKNFEVRNITFKNVPEDCIGMEGVQDGETLPAPILHGWVHNCEFYAPSISPCAESDKSGGDGACDFKRGEFFTMDYCYYEGYHKTNLVGSSDSSLQYNITWHHNQYKDCESRGPLGRQANMHIYNCLYEGQISYAMNPRANCYIFSEYNTFINCKNAMQIKSGAIKSYQDVFSGCIDAMDGTIVTDREAVVSSANKYASFELKDALSYIPKADYKLDRDVGTARQNILAYTGTMKAADQMVTPEEVNSSVVVEERKPTAAVALPYDKDINSTNAVQSGVKDNIVFNVSKLDATQATFGKDSVGQYIVFMVDETVDITMTPGGTSAISLVNQDGLTVTTDSATAEACPPGIYFIQPSSQSKGTFKEGKLTHLKIVKSASGGETHTHSYTNAEVTVEPTCTKEGTRKLSCSCGDFITEAIAKTDHTYVNGACSVCGLTEGTLSGGETDPDAPTVLVESITVTPTELTLMQGSTSQLSWAILPADATSKAVAWSSSNTAVATVSRTGVVTGKGPGTATITAQASNSKSATVTVTVAGVTSVDYSFAASDQGTQSADKNPAAEGTLLGTSNFFKVTGTDAIWRTTSSSKMTTGSLQISMQEGSGLSFTVPAGSTAQKVSITFGSTGTSNTSAVALVDAADNRVENTDGSSLSYIVGTSGGTATYADLPAGTYTVVAPKNVTPEEVGLTAFAGDSDPTDSVSDATDPNVRGARIMTVSVTVATTSGDVTIVNVTGVTLNKTSHSMAVGETVTLTSTVSPGNASNKSVTWTTSNPNVATVSGGVVTAKAAGSATITVKTSDGAKTATCAVTVTAPAHDPIKVTKITISGPGQVDLDDSITLTAAVLPEDADDGSVTWECSDPTIAKVNASGVVTGLADGKVTITATAKDGSGVKATKVISVGTGALRHGELSGDSRNIPWEFYDDETGNKRGKLKLKEKPGQDEQVLAACYDAAGRFIGVKLVDSTSLEAEISTDTPTVRLFWLGAQVAPMCQDVLAWGSLGQ